MKFRSLISCISFFEHSFVFQVKPVRVKFELVSAYQKHIVRSFFALLAKAVSEDFINNECSLHRGEQLRRFFFVLIKVPKAYFTVVGRNQLVIFIIQR